MVTEANKKYETFVALAGEPAEAVRYEMFHDAGIEVAYPAHKRSVSIGTVDPKGYVDELLAQADRVRAHYGL